MPNRNNVETMTLDEQYDYVIASLNGMIAEDEIARSPVSDGLKVVKEQLEKAEPGAGGSWSDPLFSSEEIAAGSGG